MKKRFVIYNEDEKKLAVAFIAALPIEPNHYIRIDEYRENRSLEQNALNWVWCTHIAEEYGETKDAVHFRHKKEILVPIFERDDEEYAEMLEAVRAVYRKGMKTDAKLLERKIVKLTSTTNANVTQMAEFLTEIERTYIARGIVLPKRDQRQYDVAMGRKSRGE